MADTLTITVFAALSILFAVAMTVFIVISLDSTIRGLKQDVASFLSLFSPKEA